MERLRHLRRRIRAWEREHKCRHRAARVAWNRELRALDARQLRGGEDPVAIAACKLAQAGVDEDAWIQLARARGLDAEETVRFLRLRKAVSYTHLPLPTKA